MIHVGEASCRDPANKHPVQGHTQKDGNVEDLVTAEKTGDWLHVAVHCHRGLEQDAKSVGKAAIDEQGHEAIAVSMPENDYGDETDPAKRKIERCAEPDWSRGGEDGLKDNPADCCDPNEGQHSPPPRTAEEDGVDRCHGRGN